MSENTPAQENRIETIYGDDAYVEDFRIRPVEVSDDELRLHVQMRIGGAESIYYVSATATYSDNEEDVGHHISIHRVDGYLVDEFESEVVTASPEDIFDAVQTAHEVYVQAAADWYEFARDADGAGETA